MPPMAMTTHPCPHCGGRMIIIETFERGSMPRHRPTAPNDRDQDRHLMTTLRNPANLLAPFAGSPPAAAALAQISKPSAQIAARTLTNVRRRQPLAHAAALPSASALDRLAFAQPHSSAAIKSP